MAIRGLRPLLHRYATTLIVVVILATTVTLATGVVPTYSSSTDYTEAAGFPLAWKSTTLVECIFADASEQGSLSTTGLFVGPCPAIYESSINWLNLVIDVLIYSSIGFAIVPLFRKPRTIGTFVAVLAGILATTVTSVFTFHEEIGTGYPTMYDKQGLPFPWLTFITRDIFCVPEISCPVVARVEFNWVALVFDIFLYVAIASAILFVLRPRLFGLPGQTRAEVVEPGTQSTLRLFPCMLRMIMGLTISLGSC